MRKVSSCLPTTYSCPMPIFSLPYIFYYPIHQLEPYSSSSLFSFSNHSTAPTSKHPLLMQCPSQFLILFTMVFSVFLSLVLFNTFSFDILSFQQTLNSLCHNHFLNASRFKLKSNLKYLT